MRKSKVFANQKPNRPLSEQELVFDLAAILRDRLPPGWRLDIEQQQGRTRYDRPLPRLDAVFRLTAPDEAQALIAVEVKALVSPIDVRPAIAYLSRIREGGDYDATMLIAPYLSQRSRELLAQAGIGYADVTGNLRIVVARPAIFMESSGAEASPWREEQPRRSLRGGVAGRVVRALCDFRPPYGIQDLAIRSETHISSVSRVIALLEREALISREPRGNITDVQWPQLIRRWTADYSMIDPVRTRAFQEPRGLPALMQRLKAAALPYAVTGSLAAVEVAPVAPSRLAAVYVQELGQAAERLKLRPTETGANALLIAPFDPVVFDRTWQRNGITYAALSQVAADLLTGPGRSPSEGEALIEWMKQNEDAWRA